MESIKISKVEGTELYALQYSVEPDLIYPIGVMVLKALDSLPADNDGMRVNIVETLLECRDKLTTLPNDILPLGELIFHVEYEVRDAQ